MFLSIIFIISHGYIMHIQCVLIQTNNLSFTILDKQCIEVNFVFAYMKPCISYYCITLTNQKQYKKLHLPFYMSPLRETYIGIASAYVRPSVRNASLVRAISPRFLNVEFLNFFSQITYKLKLCNKSKFKFFQTFWPKNHF